MHTPMLLPQQASGTGTPHPRPGRRGELDKTLPHPGASTWARIPAPGSRNSCQKPRLKPADTQTSTREGARPRPEATRGITTPVPEHGSEDSPSLSVSGRQADHPRVQAGARFSPALHSRVQTPAKVSGTCPSPARSGLRAKQKGQANSAQTSLSGAPQWGEPPQAPVEQRRETFRSIGPCAQQRAESAPATPRCGVRAIPSPRHSGPKQGASGRVRQTNRTLGVPGLLAVSRVVHCVFVVASVKKGRGGVTVLEAPSRLSERAFAQRGSSEPTHLSFASRKAFANGLYLIFRAVICTTRNPVYGPVREARGGLIWPQETGRHPRAVYLSKYSNIIGLLPRHIFVPGLNWLRSCTI